MRCLGFWASDILCFCDLQSALLCVLEITNNKLGNKVIRSMLKRRHYLKFEADPSPRPNPPRYSTHHELPHEAKNPTHSKSL